MKNSPCYLFVRFFWIALALTFFGFAIPKAFPSTIPEWVLQEGLNTSNSVMATKIDAQNNFYIFGIFADNPATFGIGQTNETTLVDDEDDLPFGDFYLVKYNSQGKLQWARNMKVQAYFWACNYAWIDDDLNVYLTGVISTFQTIFGVDVPNETALDVNGLEDIFVAKYAVDGNLIWAKNFNDINVPGELPDSMPYDIEGDSDGNVYIAGYWRHLPHATPSKLGDFIIIKLDKDGNTLWQYVDDSEPYVETTGKQIVINTNYIEVLDKQNRIRQIGKDGQPISIYDIPVVDLQRIKLVGNGDYYVIKNISTTTPYEVALCKYNVNEGLLWKVNAKSLICLPIFDKVEIDNDRNIHILGNYDGYIDLVDGKGREFFLQCGIPSAFVGVFDEDGNCLSAESMDLFPVDYWTLAPERGLSYSVGYQKEDFTLNGQNYPLNADRKLCITRLNRGNTSWVSGVTFFYPSHKMITGTEIVVESVGCALADSIGYYQIPVPQDWSGTVTAAHGDYTFEPNSRELIDVTEDTGQQDFWVLTPQMEYSDPGIDFHLMQDESDEIEYIISNTGAAELVWSIAEEHTALLFDGVDDCVVVEDNDGPLDDISAAITVEAWIKPLEYSTYNYIIHRSDNQENDCFAVSIDKDSQNIVWNVNNNILQAGRACLNSYTHVAASYDGSMMRVYVNGMACDSLKVATTLAVTDSDLYIGNNNVFTKAFSGEIDELRIWNCLRTAAQVVEGMHRIYNAEEDGLVACWSFNEGSGTEAADESGNGLTARLGKASGAGVPEWHIELDMDWLQLQPGSGNISVDKSGSIQLNVSTENLATGYHRCDMLITSNDPFIPELRIPVNLEACNNPVLSGRLFYTVGDDPVLHASVNVSDHGDIETDDEGRFTVELDYGWSGSIRPSKTGHSFDPVLRSARNLRYDMSGQDFYVTGADTVSVSGHIIGKTGNALVGAIVYYGSSDSVITDQNGIYAFSKPHGWSGTVRPVKNDYLFDPPVFQCDALKKDVVDLDFNSLGPAAIKISGKVCDADDTGMAGIYLSYSNSDTVQTDAEGEYLITVVNGWAGEVKLLLEGYKFDISSRIYEQLYCHQKDQDYRILGPLQVKIAGQVQFEDGAGVDGTAIQYGDPMEQVEADSLGHYEITVPYGWNGRIEPGRRGFVFDPLYREYESLDSHHLNDNYMVSGTPMMEITGDLRYLDGSAAAFIPIYYGDEGDSIRSRTDGSYRIKVPLNWSGDLVPYSDSLLFNPSKYRIKNIIDFMDLKDFKIMGPADIMISGKVCFDSDGTVIEGAVLHCDPAVEQDSVLTGTDGCYTLVVPNGWSGSVNISKINHTFNPTKKNYTDLRVHMENQNFTAHGGKLVTVHGRVFHSSGEGVADVALYSSADDSVVTDSQGYYYFLLPYAWSGTVYPGQHRWLFTPESRQYNVLTDTLDGQDFEITGPAYYTLSGRVTMSNGDPAAETVVEISNFREIELFTDFDGMYSVDVPNQWTGSIKIPLTDDILVRPGHRTFRNVNQSWTGQHFKVFPDCDEIAMVLAYEYPAEIVNVLDKKNMYADISRIPGRTLSDYKLVIFTDSSSANADQCARIPALLDRGGAAIMMGASPYLMADLDSTLAALDPWFPASTFDAVQDKMAITAIDGPLGSALALDLELLNNPVDIGYGIRNLHPNALHLSVWNDTGVLYHAVGVEAGGGKVAYFSCLDTENDACMTLFNSVIEWALNDEATAVDELPLMTLPDRCVMHPAYPNPFNPSTVLSYALPQASHVRLAIYDISGRCIIVLEDRMKSAGRHLYTWRATDADGIRVASGIYLCRLCAGDAVKTQKIILMK
ncbi:T9SS type A sorting domain-containing protein [bacterium]|nr:T9SS type A sorting domain-containing protein [bacterium]